MKTVEKPMTFSKQEAMVGYALMEARVPFPGDVLARQVPLQYKLSQGFARATSVAPGCGHAHIMALASSRLNAVKMNYTDLLGMFPNVMFLLTGASGDGKSIPLWLDTMLMHMLRKKEHQIAKNVYNEKKKKYDDWVAEGSQGAKMKEPKEPPEIDEVSDGPCALSCFCDCP